MLMRACREYALFPWSEVVGPIVKSFTPLLLASAIGAQAATRPPRVEVVCPQPPTAVAIDGKHVLVYELHVTNFGRGALEFRELDVSDADVKSGALRTYRDSALAGLLQRVGEDDGDVARLEPGERTVVYLWLETGSASPKRLAHRILFTNLDTALARR